MTNNLQTQINLLELEIARRESEKLNKELSRRNLINFTSYTMRTYRKTWVHKTYARILDLFAKGLLKNLIISMPPQHGKSELSTRRLPAFMLGRDPNLKICVSSYNQTFARKFNTQIQRIIISKEYNTLFPETTIPRSQFAQDSDNDYARTMDEFEVINYKGQVKAVGRGGSLTGEPVDIMIMDDLYKDYAEGNSPIIRESVIDWYTSVVRTRLHNDSQQLIVFTRWHEEDLVGFLEKTENVIELKSEEQLDDIIVSDDTWYKINFPALSTEDSVNNEFDIRKEEQEPLWAQKHKKEKLESFRQLDEEKFESLYQGDPKPSKGLLYSEFKTYVSRPEFRGVFNYTDTADTGKDYLCSICYGVGLDDCIYILDVLYSPEKHEVTEPQTVDMLKRNSVRDAIIESNNGGKGFARNIDRLMNYTIEIQWFYQSQNKESRIITNASEIQRKIYMPQNWKGRWPKFAHDISRFKRNFRSNAHDDAADALTGVLEWSGLLEDHESALWSK